MNDELPLIFNTEETETEILIESVFDQIKHFDNEPKIWSTNSIVVKEVWLCIKK